MAARCIRISTRRARSTRRSERLSSATSARPTGEDRYCRDKLRLVEDFSAEMFSHGESRAPLLKQRILDALDLFASRLYSLETRRRAGTLTGC